MELWHGPVQFSIFYLHTPLMIASMTEHLPLHSVPLISTQLYNHSLIGAPRPVADISLTLAV
jgi:hypothetical protein